LFEQATLTLDLKYYPGRTFTVVAANNSPQKLYVQSARLSLQSGAGRDGA
jgi:hypothetical protein